MKVCPYCYGYLNNKACDLSWEPKENHYSHYFNFKERYLNIYLNMFDIEKKLKTLSFTRIYKNSIWKFSFNTDNKSIYSNKEIKSLTKSEIDKVIRTVQLLI